MSRLPTVFISHGAPTLPIDPSMPSAEFASFATRFERPRSILMLSAHRGTAQPVASVAEQPETIHDFYGFPRELYEIQYRAPGAPELGKQAATLLTQAGIPSAITEHGLDHGAWVPLLLMFPDAGIPIAQLSIQPRLDPAHHYRVGRALRALLDYRKQAPHAVLMHPTDEHLLPIFGALGAASDDFGLGIQSLGTFQKTLAMTNYVFGDA